MHFERVIDAISKAKTAAIISHISPDGDTVGSSLAIFRALQMYGVKSYIFCDDPIKGKLASLPLSENYNTASLEEYDIAFSIDCADYQRMGNSAKEFEKGIFKVVIDHHRTNERFGYINLIDSHAAATAQIVFKLLDKMNCVDDVIAELLYSSLVTDSGGFTYSSVSPETFKVAAELIMHNIKPYEICDLFLRKISMNKFLLKNRVLSKAKFYDNGSIAIVSFLKEDFEATNTDDTFTEGVINAVKDVVGVKVSVSIAQIEDERFKVSFRTGEDVDSSRIAMFFGGGGHKNAAGCRLVGMYEEVIEKILKAIRDTVC